MDMPTTMYSRQAPGWQGHKHSDSLDSEVSFFDPSSSTSTTADSWTGYFEGWDNTARDNYCPEIVSASNSPTRSEQSDETPVLNPESLLPSARPGRRRPVSIRQNAQPLPSPVPVRRTKRNGMVPHADPDAGHKAVCQLNKLLHNPMSNTEDILAAMYSSSWDAVSLQRWYEQSQRSPADLALFKIMFSLRYTTTDPSPMPSK